MQTGLNLVFQYLKEFILKEGNLKFYILWISFNLFSIFLNYYFNIENLYIDKYARQFFKQSSVYFLFYAPAWFGTFFIYAWALNDFQTLQKKSFWLMSCFALLLFACYVSVDFHLEYIMQNIPSDFQYFIMKCTNNLIRPVVILPMVLTYWFYFDRKNRPIYGLNGKGVPLKTYFFMLLIMVPLVFAASFSEDFLHSYPRYYPAKPNWNLVENHYPAWLTTITFELCYGLDFVFIEFFFRGFMILAFLRICGPQAIFAMVTVYVFIHFQKPVGETIGSFFGGFILGILAYRTESIWGGVFIHLGVAWLMELAAFLNTK